MRARLTLLVLPAFVAACGESPTEPPPPPPPDPRLSPEQRIVGMAAGFSTTCALVENGSVFCWGENRFGEFGNGGSQGSVVAVPAMDGLRFAKIFGTQGTSRLCGITASAMGYCAGYDLNGELGGGADTDPNRPNAIVGGHQWHQIATSYHTCGVTTDRRAYCWGLDMSAALGWPAGADGPAHTPGEVAGSHRFSAITTGMQFSCALTDGEGRAYCWGWAAMVGSGSDPDASVPTPRAVAGDRSYTIISAGEYHTCALGIDQKAYCWGRSEPPFGATRLRPVSIATPRPLSNLASGRNHTCALDDLGRALCWRTGDDVQYVAGNLRFVGLTGGNEVSCAWSEGGAAYCWRFGFTNPLRGLTRVGPFLTG